MLLEKYIYHFYNIFVANCIIRVARYRHTYAAATKYVSQSEIRAKTNLGIFNCSKQQNKKNIHNFRPSIPILSKAIMYLEIIAKEVGDGKKHVKSLFTLEYHNSNLSSPSSSTQAERKIHMLKMILIINQHQFRNLKLSLLT